MHTYVTSFIKVLVRQSFHGNEIFCCHILLFIHRFTFTPSIYTSMLISSSVFLTSCYLHVLLLHKLGFILKWLELFYLTLVSWFKLSWCETSLVIFHQQLSTTDVKYDLSTRILFFSDYHSDTPNTRWWWAAFFQTGQPTRRCWVIFRYSILQLLCLWWLIVPLLFIL